MAGGEEEGEATPSAEVVSGEVASTWLLRNPPMEKFFRRAGRFPREDTVGVVDISATNLLGVFPRACA